MLVAAISGGAAIPPMTGAVATHTGNFHKAMAIPTAFYVLAWIFPIYANTVSRNLLDGHRTTDVNVSGEKKVVDGNDGVEVELQTGDGKGGTERVENVNIA